MSRPLITLGGTIRIEVGNQRLLFVISHDNPKFKNKTTGRNFILTKAEGQVFYLGILH
jgi:hypothetical protein